MTLSTFTRKTRVLAFFGAILLFMLLALPGCGGGESNARDFKAYVGIVTRGSLYGSCVFMEERDGLSYCLTNYHVARETAEVEGELTVTTPDGSSASAEIAGYSEYHDLAVITTTADFGELEPLASGERAGRASEGAEAWSVGNLGGEGVTVHGGEVTDSFLTVRAARLDGSESIKYVPVVEVTCNVGAGMSGGAVLNAEGDLIGIGTYRYDETSGQARYFAVSSDIAFAVYSAIVSRCDAGEEVSLIEGAEGYGVYFCAAEGDASAQSPVSNTLGVLIRDGYPRSPHSLGFTANVNASGMTVLYAGGGTELERGDVITAIAGIPADYDHVAQIFAYLYGCEVSAEGVPVTVTVAEGDGSREVALSDSDRVLTRK